MTSRVHQLGQQRRTALIARWMICHPGAGEVKLRAVADRWSGERLIDEIVTAERAGLLGHPLADPRDCDPPCGCCLAAIFAGGLGELATDLPPVELCGTVMDDRAWQGGWVSGACSPESGPGQSWGGPLNSAGWESGPAL
jgi:hypothetical protein